MNATRSVEDVLRTGRPTVIQDDNLKALMGAEQSQTVREITEELTVSSTVIVVRLSALGKRKARVPYEQQEICSYCS